jgi:ribokinase
MIAASVLVVGDANVDLVLRGDVVPRFGQAEQLLDAAELVLGSSASIVASGLGRLGVPTRLCAVVGDDDFGRFTLAALHSAGVDTTAVRVTADAPTGISVILSSPDDRAILTFLGTIPLLTTQDVLTAVAATDTSWVHFASPFLMPDFLASMPELLATLRARGIGTSLDTNWDPAGLWRGIAELLPLVDVLLPNRAELGAIAAVADAAVVGVSGDDSSAAAGLARLGVRVVVKDGAAGGWSLDPSGTRTAVASIHVAVVDTTGAGDSFDAGYLAAIAYGVDSEQQRLRWATVTGSLSTLGAGGTAAQPTLESLLSRVTGAS